MNRMNNEPAVEQRAISPTQLSWVDNPAYVGYRKYIGKQNGKPKAFYLGRDADAALAKVERLQRAWDKLNESGVLDWTAEAIENAVDKLGARSKKPGRPAAPTSKRATRMLHASIDEIIEYQKSRAPHRVSFAWLNGWLTRAQAVRSAMPNQPLSEINTEHLQKAVDYFEGRPVSPSTDKRIGVSTAMDRIKCVRELFDEFDKRQWWKAPHRFYDLFKTRSKSLMTSKERTTRRKIGIFTLDQLVRLYAKANERQRFLLTISLNLGATQTELSVMTREEMIAAIETGVLERARHKTGVDSRHLLWPETIKGIKRFMAKDGEIAFLTREGNAMVTYYEGGRIDPVQLSWRRLVISTNKEEGAVAITGGFKNLRKTGATWFRQLADGLALTQLYLAHAPETVADEHYAARPLETLDEPLLKFRDYLRPMFDAAKPKAVAASV